MPRTAIGLISPARRRKLAELCQDDNAMLYGTFPTSVTYDMRVEAGVISRSRRHELFSVFVTPEGLADSRVRWEQAKAELEGLFAIHHAAAAERQREAARKERMREEWLKNTTASLKYNRTELSVPGMIVYHIDGMLDYSGNPLVALVPIVQTSNYSCSVYYSTRAVTQSSNGSRAELSTQIFNGATVEDVLQGVEGSYKYYHTQYLFNKFVRDNADNLPWA